MASLTDSQIQELAELLSYLEVGGLPLPVFHQIARLTVLPAIEIIPLRLDKHDKLHVLMTQRSADDPVWPNQWHTPGRILRSTDVDDSGTFKNAFAKLIQLELPDTELGEPVLVDTEFRHVQRGAELAALHWAEVLEHEGTAATFFPVDSLPTNTISHHKPMIEKIAQHFLHHQA